MNNGRIVLEKLVLEGFGPYQEKVEFNFTEGINCYVADNEKGKSSMVAGLIATIFGLSHRQKTNSYFTLDRFRNWENPPNCRGEVTFTNGGRRYRISRNFDTHQIKFWSMGNGAEEKNGKKLLIEGPDNPEGRKILAPYKEKLQELLGMSSQELFNHTFCVEQPLPEPQNVSTELQGLLSGGGGVSFEKALEALRDKLRALTKYTGPNDRGVTSRNMAKEGQLELIEEKIKKQVRLLKNGKQVADTLLGVQQELSFAEVELEKKRKELQNKEKTRQALADWQLLASQYRHAAQERDKLRQAEEQARALEGELNELKEILNFEYPEFGQAQPDPEKYLVELNNVDQLIAQIEATIFKLEKSLQEDQGQLEELIGEQESFNGWEQLGDDPVDKLKYIRRSAETCRKEWQQFQNFQANIEEIAADFNGRFAPFQQATAEELELVGDYAFHRAELKNAVEKTKQVFNIAEAELNNFRASRSAFEARYKELNALGEGAAAALNSKLEELKKVQELEEEINGLSARVAAPMGLRPVVALILAGLVGFLIGIENPLLFAASILAAALIGFFAAGWLSGFLNRSERKKMAAVQLDLKKCRQNVAEFDAKLGQFAGADEAELGRLAQRFRQYAEEQEQLQAREDDISEEAVRELRLQKDAAEKKFLDFEQKMSVFTNAFGDVTTALHEWRHLFKEKRRLKQQLEILARETLGSSAEQAAVNDPLAAGAAENWQETARFLSQVVGGEPPAGIAALSERLNSLTPSWWQELEQKAARLAGLNKEILALKNKNSTNEKYLADEKEKRKKLQRERDGIAEGISEILQKNDDNAGAALNRWKERQQKIGKKSELEIQLKIILQNNNVEQVHELQSKASSAHDQVLVLMSKWQEHIAQNPGLPAMEQARNLEEIRGYLEEMETAMEELEKAKNNLEKNRNKLSRQLAALEGENPPNIAVAELELEDLIHEKETMELNADALTIAYKELENTLNEYRQTHKERLEKRATIYCEAISDKPGREVAMDNGFTISVRENGRPCTVEQLSKGARDQLYLALRFAVADLLAEETKLPFIFDDPFTSTDATRLENIRKILHEQAEERQFIIMAHASDFQDWGEQITITSQGDGVFG